MSINNTDNSLGTTQNFTVLSGSLSRREFSAQKNGIGPLQHMLRRSGATDNKFGVAASMAQRATRFKDLGTLDGKKSLKNTLVNEDNASLAKYEYKFKLSKISDLNIKLSQLSNSASLTLFYDANDNNRSDDNEVVTSIFGSSSQNASFSTTFVKGTYFIELDYTGPIDTSTRYHLNLISKPKPGNLSADPGSSSNKALNLQVLSGDLPTQVDLVGSLDDRDIYKFKVQQIGSFNANVGGLSSNTRMSLIFDANNNGLIDSTDPSLNSLGSSTTDGSVSADLSKGTYFIDLNYEGATSLNTRYELDLSFVPKATDLPSDPGSKANTAFDLGELSASKPRIDLNQTNGAFDEIDYYRFTLEGVDSLTVSWDRLTTSNGLFQMNLYHDANNDGLVDPSERVEFSFSGVLSFSPNLSEFEKETYFLELNAFNATTNVHYALAVATS